MRRLKVTLVISGLGAGGAEKVLSSLANHWVQRGWASTVITLERAGAAPFHQLDGRVAVIPLGLEPERAPPLRAATQMALRLMRVRAAIRASEPDIVISFMTRMNILTLLACSDLRVPIVISERNNPKEQRVNTGWSLLRALLYGRAARITALTREALEFYPPRIRKRGVVIPNAFEVASAAAPRQGPPTFVAVGRLVEQKGFDLLLQAFARVQERCGDWNLVIWGEGRDRAKLEKLRDELGLTHRVCMPGLTPKPHSWIRDAHIFVLSSRFEGMANVIGEAMAAGLPVIAFDCPWGPREFITSGDDGILIPPHNINALADAMMALAGDRSLQEKLSANAQKSIKRFAPERVLAQWDEVVFQALQLT